MKENLRRRRTKNAKTLGQYGNDVQETGVAFKECEASNSDDEEYTLVMSLSECQSCGHMVKRGHNSANCTYVGRVTEAEQDETNVQLDQTTDSD